MIYGTAGQAPPPRQITLGALSASVVEGDLVGIAFDGVEVLRRLAYPVRDEDWGTMPAVTTSETFDLSGPDKHYSRDFHVGDGAMTGRLVVEASGGKAARLSAHLTLVATREVLVNRAGFVVLHPISGVAGTPLRVTQGDGHIEVTMFPAMIAPGQPVFDIRGMRHRVEGIDVDIAFAGEVFEMEDQRNWSDASYKTYCRPLSLPRPYWLKTGEVVTQQIVVDLAGRAERGAAAQAAQPRMICPTIAIAADAGDGLALAGLDDLPIVLRCGPDLAAQDLAEVATRDLTLEIVVPDGTDPDAALRAVAMVCRAAEVRPTHVIALPAAYLASHQPEGPWPAGPAPRDLIARVRADFPEARAGTGVLTNFTELNRCPPDTAADFVSFSSTAIVHAADDLSVLQTLEALPHILRSARRLAAGRPLRLGLVSIGMRTNPYGRGVAANPGLARIAMASDDPRQRGLFGAAWAVGAVAAIAGEGVESLCLGMADGPLALGSGTGLYPIHHVVRAAANLAGQSAQKIDGEGLTGWLAQDGQGIAANLGATACPVPRGTTHVLSSATFDQARHDLHWLRKPGQVPDALPPYAIAFLQGAT